MNQKMRDAFTDSTGSTFISDFDLLVRGAGYAIVLAWMAWTVIGFYEAFGSGTKMKDLVVPCIRLLVLVTLLLNVFAS